MKLSAGAQAPKFAVEDVLGQKINLEDFKGKKIFLAFLRNTNCPLCSLHLYKLSKIAPQLKQNDMEVVVFYESNKKMFSVSTYFKETVFDKNILYIVSDPSRNIYKLYNAEINSSKNTLEVLQKAGRLAELEEAAKLGIKGKSTEEGTNADAIPCDFLIDENFKIQLAHYGNDSGDHIDLAVVEKFAKEGTV